MKGQGGARWVMAATLLLLVVLLVVLLAGIARVSAPGTTLIARSIPVGSTPLAAGGPRCRSPWRWTPRVTASS